MVLLMEEKTLQKQDGTIVMVFAFRKYSCVLFKVACYAW